MHMKNVNSSMLPQPAYLNTASTQCCGNVRYKHCKNIDQILTWYESWKNLVLSCNNVGFLVNMKVGTSSDIYMVSMSGVNIVTFTKWSDLNFVVNIDLAKCTAKIITCRFSRAQHRFDGAFIKVCKIHDII